MPNVATGYETAGPPSVHDEWGIRCPKCDSDNRLDVAASVLVRLTADGTVADESANGSHEWDRGSVIFCRECGHHGLVGEFTTDDAEPEEAT